MKRFNAALLCLLALPAGSAPYELQVIQRDASNAFNWSRSIAPLSPVPTTHAVLMYDGVTTLPVMGALGSGLAWNGATLSVSLPNTGSAGTYSGVTTDAQGRVTAGTARSFSYTTRALNTCFQASATRDASVSYAVDIAATLSLSGGQQGTVFLELFSDSGCTTGTQEVTRATNGNTGTLSIGLSTVQTGTARLQGVVPAGMYLRLRTSNDTGTPTFTARPGQEVLL